MSMRALELFCGCGGFSEGMKKAGIRVMEAIDNNPKAVEVYNRNHGTLVAQCADVVGYYPTFDTPDLVFGGPACQPYSPQGKRDPSDSRRGMVWEFVRVVGETHPSYFVMENVIGLTQGDNRYLLNDLVKAFQGLGYEVCNPWVLNAYHYGVPQKRRRLFLVGYSKRCKPPMQPVPWLPSTRVTAGEALYQPYPSGEITGTEVTRHAEGIKDRYRATPQGEKEPHSWFPKLTYAEPSPTITGAGRFIHPIEPRILTVRECARLQSFPDRYWFPKSKVASYLMIGNAVPPRLGAAVGGVIYDAWLRSAP